INCSDFTASVGCVHAVSDLKILAHVNAIRGSVDSHLIRSARRRRGDTGGRTKRSSTTHSDELPILKIAGRLECHLICSRGVASQDGIGSLPKRYDAEILKDRLRAVSRHFESSDAGWNEQPRSRVGRRTTGSFQDTESIYKDGTSNLIISTW